MSGWRKVGVFAACLVVAMITPLYMEIEEYKVFLNNLVWLAGAFFTSNVVSNVGSSIRDRFFARKQTGDCEQDLRGIHQ